MLNTVASVAELLVERWTAGGVAEAAATKRALEVGRFVLKHLWRLSGAPAPSLKH